MNYNLRWDLLAPVDVGGAVQAGFERGATRSALADLATDPTNESALSRLAMFQPELAIRMGERARQERFRQGVRSAFDVNTGNVDPVAMRRAYVDAGDAAGAMEFDRTRAATTRTQQTADYDRMRRMADLLDDSTDAASYARNRATAIQLGLGDATAIPEQFDPAWVAQQRQLVGVLSDRSQMTPFMREFQAAGWDLNTPEGQQQFRTMMQNRYAAPPRIMMVNGQPMLVGGDGATGAAPAPAPDAPERLTDDDFANDGGPTQPGSGNFP